jgi:hypothetical protein
MGNKEPLVTHKEFIKVTDNLAIDLLDVKERVRRIEENILTKADGDRMFNRFDSVAEWIITSKDKELVQDHRLNELESKTANHESRLTRLEPHS